MTRTGLFRLVVFVRQSTQRKALAAVLGLGVTALLTDRLFLSPADAGAAPPAAAAEPAPAVAAKPATLPAPPPAETGAVRGNLLAALGAASWDQRQIQSSLRPTPAWALFADPEPAKAAPAVSADGKFRERYRLKAVIREGGTAAALIGDLKGKQGTVLRLGSILDGFRLVRVDQGVAYFEGAGQAVQLEIAETEGGLMVPQAGPQR